MYLYTEANKKINCFQEELQLKDKNLCDVLKRINETQNNDDIQKNRDDLSLSQNMDIDLVYTTSNKLKEQITYNNLVAYPYKTSNYYITLDDMNKVKSTLLNKITELEKYKISLESELSNLKEENEKIQSQKLASTALCKTLDANYQQLKSNFEKYKSDMTQSIKSTIKQSSTTIQKLKQEKMKLKEENINLKAKYEKLEKEGIEKNQQIEEIKTLKQKYEIHLYTNKKIIEKIITKLNTKLTQLMKENEDLKEKNENLDEEVTNYSNLIHVNEENGSLEISQTPISTKSFSFNNYSPSPSPPRNINKNLHLDDVDNNSFDSFGIISPIRPDNNSDNDRKDIICSLINYNSTNCIVNLNEINMEESNDIILPYKQRIVELENNINEMQIHLKEVEEKNNEINTAMNEIGRRFSESSSFDSISLDRSLSFSSPRTIKILTFAEGDVISCNDNNNNNNVIKLKEENMKMKEDYDNIMKIYTQVQQTLNSTDNSLDSSLNISTIGDDDDDDDEFKVKVKFGIKVYDFITIKDTRFTLSPAKHREIDINKLLIRQKLNQSKKMEEKYKSESPDSMICLLCKKTMVKKMICHLCKKSYCYDCCKNHVLIPGKKYKRFICDKCNSNLNQN